MRGLREGGHGGGVSDGGMSFNAGTGGGGAAFAGSYLPETDISAGVHFGRMKIGTPTGRTDEAMWSHEDFFTSSNWGGAQLNDGETWLNTVSTGGGGIKFGRAYSGFLAMDLSGHWYSLIGANLGTDGNPWGGMYMEEVSAPSAPSANNVVIYTADNGGKTTVYALFNSGAAQVIAAEP